jgi:carboxypeptidase C (cathepsin A)
MTSLGGATAENGPYSDSNSTTSNPWSWNKKFNMLYLGQPVQVGFKYNDLIASMLDLLSGTISSSNGSEI